MEQLAKTIAELGVGQVVALTVLIIALAGAPVYVLKHFGKFLRDQRAITPSTTAIQVTFPVGYLEIQNTIASGVQKVLTNGAKKDKLKNVHDDVKLTLKEVKKSTK